MKLDKIHNRVKSELIRSPRKSALLVLMLPFVFYYWVPLIKKWTRNGSASRSAVMGIAMQTAGGALFTGTSPADAGTLDCSFLINQLLDDGRRRSLGWNEGQRNPFENGTVLANDAVAVESTVTGGSLAEAVRIAEALRLEGTAVGARTSVATVNGRVFSVGETVDVRKLGVPDATWQFAQLEQIQVDSVVLRFGEFRATMRLPTLRRDYEP